MTVILDPTAELKPIPRKLSPLVADRVASVALVDISKPKGDILLDRVEKGLRRRFPDLEFVRYRKPTFAKPAPPDLRAEIARSSQMAILALAD